MIALFAILLIGMIILSFSLINRHSLNKPPESDKGDVGQNDMAQRKVGQKQEPESIPDSADELSKYPFLKKVPAREVNCSPEECHDVKYVYYESSDTHYIIQDAYLHVDEQKLSELRVKLYEHSMLSSESPMLVCSCCRQPVYLTGTPGTKGQIARFCHAGEGHSSGDPASSDYSQAPKQESEYELNALAQSFCCFKLSLDNLNREDTFLAIPGTDKSKAGDITFTYGENKVAVIFISASHTLDFIIRRARNAKHRGCIPIWLITKDWIDNQGMSVRDISTFSGGYVCSVDEETERIYRDDGKITLFARVWDSGEETYIPLQKYIEDCGKNLPRILDANPVKHRKKQDAKPDKKKVAKAKSDPPEEPSPDTVSPRQKVTYTPVDYWEGKRFHIKGSLYIEKIDGKYGVLDLAAQRNVIYTIYDSIEVSSDKNSVITHLNGETKTWKL